MRIDIYAIAKSFNDRKSYKITLPPSTPNPYIPSTHIYDAVHRTDPRKRTRVHKTPICTCALRSIESKSWVIVGNPLSLAEMAWKTRGARASEVQHADMQPFVNGGAVAPWQRSLGSASALQRPPGCQKVALSACYGHICIKAHTLLMIFRLGGLVSAAYSNRSPRGESARLILVYFTTPHAH